MQIMKIKNRYILWLPSWYPSQEDKLTGDFIQRHAQAVAQFQNVVVLHLVKVDAPTGSSSPQIAMEANGRLTEYLIYYTTRKSSLYIFERYYSIVALIRNYLLGWSEIKKQWDRPSLLHVHVAKKASLIALFFSLVYNIPLVITEHWDGFLNNGKTGFRQLHYLHRLLIRWTFKRAVRVSAVSAFLAENLANLFCVKQISVIPNVVNTEIFKPVGIPDKEGLKLIHVSSLNHPKNPKAIIAGFKLFKQQGLSFSLTMVGPLEPSLEVLITEAGLVQEIKWLPEMPQHQLSSLMSAHHALVLYSLHETFGCVLIEANACGLPVLVSDVPVFKELIEDGKNGLIGKGKDAGSLAELLVRFVSLKDQFDNLQISKEASRKYNYEQVGKAFAAWYAVAVRP